MNYLSAIFILLFAFSLAGCSYFSSSNDELAAGDNNNLVTPPDLISNDFNGDSKVSIFNEINYTNNDKLEVSVYKTKEGYATLVLPYEPVNAWIYLGKTLDKIGIVIKDSDELERSYYLEISKQQDKNLFSKFVGDIKTPIQLVVKYIEDGYSQVIFNDISEANEQKTIDFSFAFFKEIRDQF